MSERIEDFLSSPAAREMLENVGRYLRVQCGVITPTNKVGPGDVEMTAIHAALTYMDNFVQDVIALKLTETAPSIRLILEEKSQVRKLSLLEPYCGSVLIDPIDGTAEFVAGGKDFSILICLLKDGQPKISVGYYPFGDHILDNGKCADDLPETKILACHYRINHGEDGGWGGHLRRQGYETPCNGKGFATNLTAAQMVIDGRADALVFPYTAAHDAIVPAHIVAQHGGVARRYALGPKWSSSTRQPFTFADVEQDHNRDEGSSRVRVIAARSNGCLDEIESILGTA
ncbi:MAG: inositol monophosphatase family protein [Roseobacter sp.]